MSFNKQEYDNNYSKEHYARISALIPKAQKPIVDEHYKKLGFGSMSEYINFLIREDMRASR